MQYAAFFRGINVGGKNKVKMADLAQMFTGCGFEDVRTYIQSGNVLFSSDGDRHALPGLITAAFTEKFSFQSPVVLYSADELQAVAEGLPFTGEEIRQAEEGAPEVEHVYIYLTNDPIDPVAVEKLQNAFGSEDILRVGEHALYLLCRQSVRDSKLAASLAKLKASLTARNQKTLRKICELLSGEAKE